MKIFFTFIDDSFNFISILFSMIPDIASYAKTLTKRKVEMTGPKIVGKMDIAELERLTKKKK